MDKSFKKDFVTIGCSSAASWAWGTSLIMGQEIAQEKGLVAWFIWAICNSLTLALFGYLINKGIIKKEIYEKKGIKAIALLIQLFCLLVQLNFINQQILILSGNPVLSYALTIAIGAFFTLIVFKKGLPTSIKTDVGQWALAIVAILVIIGVGLGTGAPLRTFVETKPSGIMWGIWSGLILISGPIGDVQHWQRAESDKSKKGYYLGGALFALYMLLILGMAVFEFTPLMHFILLIAVLCITTSTIDSIAVALHKLGDKRKGTAVALLICIFWGVFVEMGMVDLWSSFGIVRVALAVSILILPFAYAKNGVATITGILATIAVTLISIVLGLYSLGNIFGIVCICIAGLIFAGDILVLLRAE